MTAANSVAGFVVPTASDRLDIPDDDDADRLFCDGGAVIDALGSRKCWKCGAGPDDECRADIVFETSNR
jgi:hypothetical protein